MSVDPLTERDRELYLDGLRQGLTKTQAAGVAGRHRETFRSFAAKDAGFAELERKAYHEDGRDALIAKLQEAVADDTRWNATTLMFLIKQRDPSFRENAKAELDAGPAPEVKVSIDFGGALDALEQAGVLVRREAAGDAAAGVGAERKALLPARADGEADGGADGSPVPSA